MAEYARSDFNRRKYTVESPLLEKDNVEITVRVGGKVLARVQAREPGIIAFVSKPKEPGFDLELVQVGGVRYTDAAPIEGEAGGIANWQAEALGVE